MALSYIERRPELHIGHLSPSTRIFDYISKAVDDVSILENVEFISYQRLHRMTEQELLGLQFDVIFLDEYHRCGAKLWQIAIRKLVENNPKAILIGLSATPIRYLDSTTKGIRDMTKELFNSSVAHQYTLSQAISDGILPKPMYVLADIEQRDILAAAEKRYEEMKKEGISANFTLTLAECIDEMRRNIQNAEGVEEIFEKYLPRNAKLIVFCRGYEHMKEVNKSIKEWMGSSEVHSYVCKANDLDYDADEQLSEFKEDKSDCVRLLYTVDMLNEGVHIDDLTGVVMLRPTASPNVYLQQIGRCLASGKSAVQPIVFDLVNNYQRARVKESDGTRNVLNAELGQYRDRNGESSDRFDLLDFRVSDSVLNFSKVAERFNNMTSNTRDEQWMEMFLKLKEEYQNKGEKA